MKFFLQTRND